MKRTKIMATVLVATMAIASFTACSKKEEETTASKEQETVETSETTKETTESETTTESATEETTVETTAPAEENLTRLFVGYEERITPELYLDYDNFFYNYPDYGQEHIISSVDGVDYFSRKITEEPLTLKSFPDCPEEFSTEVKVEIYQAKAEDGSAVIIFVFNGDKNIVLDECVPLYYDSNKGCIISYLSGLKFEIYFEPSMNTVYGIKITE